MCKFCGTTFEYSADLKLHDKHCNKKFFSDSSPKLQLLQTSGCGTENPGQIIDQEEKPEIQSEEKQDESSHSEGH